MMKELELFLNIIHYCLYKLDFRLHLLFNKFNPFLLLGKIPAVKEKFKERKTSLVEVVNKVWGDKRYGFGVMISGGALAIIVFLMVWAIFVILNNLLKHPFRFSFLPFALCMFVAYSICHLLVFKEDKYLQYFRQFDKSSNQKKWSYALLSFGFISIAITLFICSFKFL